MRFGRVGILGGSFDPPHNGHLALARHAAGALALDCVLLVPAAQSPLKGHTHFASAEARLAMTRAAALAHGAEVGAVLEVSDWEICNGGTSYSFITATYLRGRFPDTELFWIIGADQVPRLPDWHRISELARLVTFAVANRPDCPPVVRPAGLDAAVRIMHLPEFRMDISSTRAREAVRSGAATEFILPEAVRDIIEQRQLYR